MKQVLKRVCKTMLAKCKQKIPRTQKITRISRLNIQNTRLNEVPNHNIWVPELSLNRKKIAGSPVGGASWFWCKQIVSKNLEVRSIWQIFYNFMDQCKNSYNGPENRERYDKNEIVGWWFLCKLFKIVVSQLVILQ